MKFFATTPKGLELLLVEELKTLGAENPKEKLAGVIFEGDLELAYKVCLWSRLANRVLLYLTDYPAENEEELYAGAQAIQWDRHFIVNNTFAIHFVSVQSNITHTLYGAQKVKDAIVDQFNKKLGSRPNVQKEQPDISIFVYLHRNNATLYLDLSGESLHRRGYRQEQVQAPLKENLAAGILMRAGWENIASSKGALIDPMCGSGTLLIEAALMAGKIAPALFREYFGFLKWQGHDPQVWKKLKDQAYKVKEENWDKIPTIIGYDKDPTAIKIAFANIERANLHGKIHVEKCELDTLILNKKTEPGLVITNPPYGERLGEVRDLKELYGKLGDKLKAEFSGWKAAIFTSEEQLGKSMGIRAQKRYALYNGAIKCDLLLLDINEQFFIDRSPEAENKRRIVKAKKAVTQEDLQAVEMFVNRLCKRFKHLKKIANREQKTEFEIYNADIPEYPVIIDWREQGVFVHAYPQPYKLKKEVFLARINSILAVLPEALKVPEEKIFFDDYENENPSGWARKKGE